MSAICLRGVKEQRVAFIFRLFDEDGSGRIDRDEFAELVSGMMLTQGVSADELKQALEEEFDAADTDNSGQLDEKEFVAAASNSQRLSSYFERLSKISMSEAEEAQARKKRREEIEAARVLQSRYRGWSTRKKMKDPNWSMHQRVSAPDGEAGDDTLFGGDGFLGLFLGGSFLAKKGLGALRG